MKPSVMVPLDGSPFAERAVPLATALARRTGSSLCFVRVHVDALDADWPAAPFRRFDAVRRSLESTQLEELATRVARSTGLRVRPGRGNAEPYLFHRRHLPPHRRWWRTDEPEPPIR